MVLIQIVHNCYILCAHNVFMFVGPGSQPNDTSAVCFPECKPGQCCMDGKCYCFDADNNTMKECPGMDYKSHCINTVC